jgi:hypothetical protein
MLPDCTGRHCKKNIVVLMVDLPDKIHDYHCESSSENNGDPLASTDERPMVPYAAYSTAYGVCPSVGPEWPGLEIDLADERCYTEIGMRTNLKLFD